MWYALRAKTHYMKKEEVNTNTRNRTQAKKFLDADGYVISVRKAKADYIKIAKRSGMYTVECVYLPLTRIPYRKKSSILVC